MEPTGRVLTPEELLGLERLPPALSVRQTATLLGVSRQTVYRAVEAGDLQGLQVRNRVVVATRPLLEALGWGDRAARPAEDPIA